MPTYAELRLRIDRGVAPGSYRIVATGPAGEALGRFKLPFADIELENFILKVGSTRRGRRRIDSPEMELAKTFGTKLFGALFEGDVRELYRSSIAESRADGRGLRLTLSLTGAPELLQVPWEYLYDHPSFLSISTWTPIVRYLDLPKPRRPLQIDLPLRILGLVSAPSDFEAIDAEQERAKLEGALAPLIEVGAIAIDWLGEASLRALQRQLRKADYHVFHYIGHGGYDNDADDGVLMFEDEHGRGQRVSGVQLGRMLADEVSLRLAVLNSCEGGRSSLQDPFSGVATSLIEFEIPAVIGMQFEITDRAAIVFGGEFYSALADGLAVDAAVAEARKAIYADQNDVEWGTPVLFMRVADGKLFDVKAHTPLRVVDGVAARNDAIEIDEAVVAAAAAAEVAEREPAEKAAADAEAAAEAERVAEAERAAEQARVQHEAEAAAEAERKRVADAEAAAEAERTRLAEAAAVAESQRVERERADQDAARAAAAVETERIEAERTRIADAEAEAERAAEQARVQREAEAAAEGERKRVAEAEAERIARERVEQEAEAARIAAVEAQRVEAERIEAERIEAERVEAELLEQERMKRDADDLAERQRVADAEAAGQAERLERERVEREAEAALAAAVEVERLDAERVEQERLKRHADEAPERDRGVAAALVLGSQAAEAAEATEPKSAIAVEAVHEPVVSREAGSQPDTPNGALSRIPEYQLRAAGRAAVGGVLTMSFAWVGDYLERGGYDVSPYLVVFVGAAAFLAIAYAVAVTLAERYVPAIRVPDGAMYRFAGGNPLAAAAIEGALISATLGSAVMWLFYPANVDADLSTILGSALVGALTFVVAEAVIARIWRRRLGSAAVASAAPDVTITGKEVHSDAAVAVPPGLGRPAGRAALGSLLGLAMTWLWEANFTDRCFCESFEFYWNIFVSEAVWTVLGMVVAVALAEAAWPAVRVPDGRAYRAVGGNRWAAATLQGAVVGATVGFAATNAYYLIVRHEDQELTIGTVVTHGAFTAIGFLIAEVILVRLTRLRDKPVPSP